MAKGSGQPGAKTPRPSARSLAALANQRQEHFVLLMLQPGMTATEAYVRAYGAKRSTAEKLASRLMRNDGVANAIAEGRAKLAKRLELTAERTLSEVARLAYSDIGELEDPETRQLHRSLRDIPEDARRAIRKVKVKSRTFHDEDAGDVTEETVEYELHDKNAALDKAMRNQGLYPKEAVEVELKFASLVALAKKLRDKRLGKEGA